MTISFYNCHLAYITYAGESEVHQPHVYLLEFHEQNEYDHKDSN
jgi:hypothetical protein